MSESFCQIFFFGNIMTEEFFGDVVQVKMHKKKSPKKLFLNIFMNTSRDATQYSEGNKMNLFQDFFGGENTSVGS